MAMEQEIQSACSEEIESVEHVLFIVAFYDNHVWMVETGLLKKIFKLFFLYFLALKLCYIDIFHYPPTALYWPNILNNWNIIKYGNAQDWACLYFVFGLHKKK